jgi:CDP-diacylglycerol--serine O-phosphatidyltransferase
VAKKSILRKVSVADIITTMNAVFGILAIIFLLRVFPDGDITVGTTCIIIALILDGCDGAAARRFGSKHDRGKDLDSIADAISFCTAPAVLIFVVFYNGVIFSAQGILTIVAMVLIATLGWRRLYKFSLEGYKLKVFSGLPTPANALLLVMIAHILGPLGLWYIALPFAIIAAILMVSPVPYPKVRGKVAVVLAICITLAIVILTTYKTLYGSETAFASYQAIALAGLAMVLIYVFGGPVFEKTVVERAFKEDR